MDPVLKIVPISRGGARSPYGSESYALISPPTKPQGGAEAHTSKETPPFGEIFLDARLYELATPEGTARPERGGIAKMCPLQTRKRAVPAKPLCYR